MTGCVVITGHLGGIGRALTEAFENAGHPVVGIDRRHDPDISSRHSLAPLNLARLLLPRLTRSNGSISNIGSIHSDLSKPEFSPYAISKAALSAVSRAPDEIARVVLALVESDATFLNGTVVNIDGGISHRLHDPSLASCTAR